MPFYITTPIYYINAEPHLGHAYTTMVADAIARAKKLLGNQVFFLTGTDEHGQKVERAARKSGLKPKVFADQTAATFQRLFRDLRISNDDFIRTTEPRHHRAVERIWRRMARRDVETGESDIYKSRYEGWYCTVDEVFVPESQIGDGQRCPLCGGSLERLSEESYYFRLSKYQKPLLDHFRAHPSFVEPAIRRNEVVAFIEAGLQDLSISRTSFTWGIPVPDDPSHVVYVWVDALTNYLTAVGFGSDAVSDQERFAELWPADVHLIGKDILRQHAVYWPAMLLSAELPLPRKIVVHGHWLMAGAKMSKSRGNVVEPAGYARRFGVDALRYFVLREMTLGQDAVFADEAVLTRYNADLANDLGNLVSRVTTMIQRYRDGTIPKPRVDATGPQDNALEQAAGLAIEAVRHGATRFDFSQALRDLWEFISKTNKYLVAREPWMLAKDPAHDRALDTTLYYAADALRIIAALLEPVMPDTATRIRRMLGIEREDWIGLEPGKLKPDLRLGTIEPLFPRIEETVEELQREAKEIRDMQGDDKPTAAVEGGGDSISLDEFMRVDLRVAKILAAERVKNSRKLVKLEIDLGTDQRTVVAGIADAYEPEALVGRFVVVVANLRPAKLMGVESNGMILAASAEGGPPNLLTFDRPPQVGMKVR